MSTAPPQRRAPALLLAAMAGATVMVVELGVARILTPVFGGSIAVWAIVIATTMLALAIGYAVGGWWADRSGGLRVAARSAWIGALLCAVVPFVRLTLTEATIDLPTLLGAAIAAPVLLGPTLFFLSQVSPALIRGLAGSGLPHLGSTAGSIYAISTLGSLVGTLAGVWAFLYTSIAVTFTLSGLLVAITAVLLRPRLAAMGAMAILIALLGWLLLRRPVTLSAYNAAGEPCTLVAREDSAYGELRVIDQDNRYRYLVVNGTDQGGIELATGESAYGYVDGLEGLAQLYADRPQSALVIGLGAGVLTQKLTKRGWKTDTVEIDPAVLRVARKYFGFKGEAAIDDGRRYLQRTDHTWDVIVIDAFLGANPPWQLYTREAFATYRSRLSPRGAVVLNFIGSHVDPEQRPALEAVVATARTVFPTVDTYPDPWVGKDYPTRNLYIVASLHPRRLAAIPGDPDPRTHSLAEAIADGFPVPISGGRILTDDSAPLAPLVSRTTEILRGRIGEYLPLAVLLQ